MKKIMWTVAMIPVVVTSVVLQFMPDIIPMHHDLEGNTDRWGSKTESFIFPVIILFITLFWHLLIYVFEKKSKNANTEKEQMEAKSSAKVLCVVGISQAIMFGIMHYFILYSSWIQANAGGEHAVIDIAKVSCILCGIVFIVLGNFMTKAKRNTVVCIFRKNCASVPEERSAIPLQTEQSSAGLLVAIIYSTIPARKFKTICLGCHSA